MKNEIKINALIEGCRRSDRICQKQLYNEFYGFAMNICLRYSASRQDAADIMNRGFYKVFLHLEKYDQEKSFKAWLGRIMINASLDSIRTRARQNHCYNIEDFEIGHPSLTDKDIDYKQMLAMVQRLPKQLRNVFNLYAIDGYTHKEIGELLGKSNGTSKFHLFQAREMLKKMVYVNQ